MRIKHILAAVSVAAMTATTAAAGGLAPAAPTTVVVPVEPAAPAPSSWGIVLPILGAALLIALATQSDDKEENITVD